MPQGNPKSGEKYYYQDNQDQMCQVVAVATHSRTGEKLVVCQELYGSFEVYAVPLADFINEEDSECCLESQDSFSDGEEQERIGFLDGEEQGQGQNDAPSNSVNDLLMAFYDAGTYEEKYKILCEMRDGITDVMIDNMAVVLDIVIPEGDTDKRYEELKRCLRTCQRYEINRW